MTQIRDIMEKNVVTIEHDKTCHNAAKLLEEKNVSFLVIIKEDEPIGVVTERDFVRKLVSHNLPSETPLSDIMSPKFRSVEPSTSIEDAIQKMLNNNIRRLLVLENEKLCGVITETDLVSYLRSKVLINTTIENLGSK